MYAIRLLLTSCKRTSIVSSKGFLHRSKTQPRRYGSSNLCNEELTAEAMREMTANDVAQWALRVLKIPDAAAAVIVENAITGPSLLALKSKVDMFKLSQRKLPVAVAETMWRKISSGVEENRKEILTRFFTASIEQELANFELPSLADEEAKRNEEHRSYLQQLYKESLAFNPLQKGVDIRFLQKQTQDPIYDLLTQEATSATPKNIYILRAISGGGKTGAVLNAIGRNQYLIYFDCRPLALDIAEYDDANFKAFHDDLTTFLGANATDANRTQIATTLCSAFLLTRFMLLDYMKRHFNISPTNWLFWTINGGKAIIRNIQNTFLTLVETEIKISGGDTTIINSVLRTQLAEHADKAWIAFDEAQAISGYYFGFQMLPAYENTSQAVADGDQRRSLLHVLAVYALPTASKRVVLGTGMTDFIQLIGSGGAKDCTSYNFTEPNLAFPYLEPHQSLEILKKFFHLQNVSPELLNTAKKVLQGRLRYVFRFITEMYEAAKQINPQQQPLTANQMDMIFRTALAKLQDDIKTAIENQLRTKATDERIIWHLIDVLSAYENGLTLEWDTKDFEANYHITAEITGFLFINQDALATVPTTRYCYSIREPFVAEVLNNLQYIKNIKDMRIAHTIQTSANLNRGIKLENFLLNYLAENANKLASILPATAPEWCFALNYTWNRSAVACNNVALDAAVKNLLSIKKQLKSLMTYRMNIKAGKKSRIKGPQIEEEVYNALLGDDFMQKIVEEDNLSDATIATLYQISCAPDDKIAELLFCYVKPLNFLLHPLAHFGPDLFGFLKTKTGIDVCVAISISIQNEPDKDKFQKNVAKTNPKNFYINNNKFKKIYMPLLKTLPRNVLRINITLPYEQKQPQIFASQYLVHVNEDSFEQIVSLKGVLANLKKI